MHVVALSQVDGDDAVVMAGDHRFVSTGQQIERQAVLRVLLTVDDREPQFVQFGDQTPFRPLRFGEGRECGGITVAGTGSGQPAGRAQLPDRLDIDQPITLGQMQIGTQMAFLGIDGPAGSGFAVIGDHQEGHVRQGEPHGAAAGQAQRVLERQMLSAPGTTEVTHRGAPHPPIRRSH